MPRNMSFFLTQDQVRSKTKTVTRRQGWNFLKVGDILNAVEKGQGLKKGEKVKKICQIRVLHLSRERINRIDQSDTNKEGFPEWSPDDFIQMYCAANSVKPDEWCNRIEFEYL